MGAESRLFCGSEPASCWIAVGEAWSGEQAKTIMVALKDYYTSLTGARPRTHFDHSPDLVRLTPLHFPSPPRIFLTPQFLSLSPRWKQTVGHLLSILQLCPPQIAPLVKDEPQRSVTEEEPKIAGDLDQEPVRAWGWEGDCPESLRKWPKRDRSLYRQGIHTSEILLPSFLPFRACSTQTWIVGPSEGLVGCPQWSLLMPPPSMRLSFEGKPLLQTSQAVDSHLSVNAPPLLPPTASASSLKKEGTMG